PRLRGQGEAGLRGDAPVDRAGRGRRDRLGRHAPAPRERLPGPGEPDRPGRIGQGPPPLSRVRACAGASAGTRQPVQGTFAALRGAAWIRRHSSSSSSAAAPGIAWNFLWRTRRPSVEPVPSIAVLPFADMRSCKDQEYFSDGIAEEILNGLAQIEGLRVAGRTSSFSFKGKQEDLRSISQKLNVRHVLEGSVRRDGDRVRVTAQLVDASDGYHRWSAAYEHDLKTSSRWKTRSP